MREPFGEIVTIFVVIIGLFVLPLMYAGQKQDAVLQSFVYYQTVRFVEDVGKNGYITQTMYDDFNRQLASADVVFEIKMEHVHDVIEPVFSSDGTSVVSTSTYTSAKYEDDILHTLYSDKEDGGVYKFRQGDYFTVTVLNSSKTIGQQLSRIITDTSSKYAVYVTFGGVVRNAG